MLFTANFYKQINEINTSMAAILNFKMADKDKIENCPIAFVAPKNIYLDTKIMFLCHLETEISIFEYFVTHEILGDGAQIQT